MKSALQLSALLCVFLLTGSLAQVKKFQQPGMDSPIIISDGSLHLRHQSDFAPSDEAGVGKKASVYIGVYKSAHIECVNAGNTCPPSGETLAAGWKLEGFTSDDATGSPILQATASGTSIVAHVHGRSFTYTDDVSGDAPRGKDLKTADSNFKSAKLTNGASLHTIKCSGSGRCKVCIVFVPNSGSTAGCPRNP